MHRSVCSDNGTFVRLKDFRIEAVTSLCSLEYRCELACCYPRELTL